MKLEVTPRWRKVIEVGAQDAREAAMRANYATPANLKKRQSLHAFTIEFTGQSTDSIIAAMPGHGRVVDIGCGNGLWMPLAAQRGHVVGVDLSTAMLQEAVAREGGPVLRGDATQLPFRSNSFDVALMLWMLYHVTDKAAALEEAKRVLTPGGRLLASTSAKSEAGTHADIIATALNVVLQRDVGDWLEPVDFNAANGEGILSHHFDSVTTYPWTAVHELHDPTPLVDYVDSGREPIEAELGSDLPWDDILRVVEALAAEHINVNGSLRFNRTGATFVASQVASRSIGPWRVAQHRCMATARRAAARTAPRAGAGRPTDPRTTPHRPPSTGAVGVRRPAVGRLVGSEAVPCRTRPPNGARLSLLPARRRSRRWPIPSVVTCSCATPGTTETVPRGSCTVC